MEGKEQYNGSNDLISSDYNDDLSLCQIENNVY